MAKEIKTVTTEYDEEGRIAKQTTVTEIPTDEVNYPVHYPTFPSYPSWYVGTSSPPVYYGTYTTS